MRDHILDLIFNPLLNVVHGSHQGFPRVFLSSVAWLTCRCYVTEYLIPPMFLFRRSKQLLVSSNLKFLGLAFNSHIIELLFPLLLIVLRNEIKQEHATLIVKLGLPVVVMLLGDLLFLHLPNFVLQLPLVLDVVVLDGCLVTPVQYLSHGGFHVSRLILHAKYDRGLGLQRL